MGSMIPKIHWITHSLYRGPFLPMYRMPRSRCIRRSGTVVPPATLSAGFRPLIGLHPELIIDYKSAKNYDVKYTGVVHK